MESYMESSSSKHRRKCHRGSLQTVRGNSYPKKVRVKEVLLWSHYILTYLNTLWLCLGYRSFSCELSMSMLDESGEPLQPLVDEESSTLPRFNGSGQSEQSEKSEQHLTTPWFVKLGVAALIAGAAVALWHFSPSLKSLAPGGTLKSYEDSEEWPQWSDGDDEGWDDGDSGVDDGFGLTRHESQTSAYGYASNNGYDEGEGSNAKRIL